MKMRICGIKNSVLSQKTKNDRNLYKEKEQYILKGERRKETRDFISE